MNSLCCPVIIYYYQWHLYSISSSIYKQYAIHKSGKMQSWEADFTEVTYSAFASAAKLASQECISLQEQFVAVGAWRLNAWCRTECGKHKRKTRERSRLAQYRGNGQAAACNQQETHHFHETHSTGTSEWLTNLSRCASMFNATCNNGTNAEKLLSHILL